MKLYPGTICRNCGNPFPAKTKHIKFCSRKCVSDFATGPNHHNYKGGFLSRGYKTISVKGRRVLEHRYVMEQHIGRLLRAEEVVHHKDGNKSNNAISNLELFASQSEHARAMRCYSTETEKYCTGCGIIKPASEYQKNRFNWDGRQAQCRACIRDKERMRDRNARETPPG